jgi:hypothetical protein
VTTLCLLRKWLFSIWLNDKFISTFNLREMCLQLLSRRRPPHMRSYWLNRLHFSPLYSQYWEEMGYWRRVGTVHCSVLLTQSITFSIKYLNEVTKWESLWLCNCWPVAAFDVLSLILTINRWPYNVVSDILEKANLLSVVSFSDIRSESYLKAYISDYCENTVMQYSICLTIVTVCPSSHSMIHW